MLERLGKAPMRHRYGESQYRWSNSRCHKLRFLLDLIPKQTFTSVPCILLKILISIKHWNLTFSLSLFFAMNITKTQNHFLDQCGQADCRLDIWQLTYIALKLFHSSLIALISHNRHNRRWCTFFKLADFFPQRTQKKLLWAKFIRKKHKEGQQKHQIWQPEDLVYQPKHQVLQPNDQVRQPNNRIRQSAN